MVEGSFRRGLDRSSPMKTTNPSIDLAEVYDRLAASTKVPYALMGTGIFAFVVALITQS